MAYVQQSIDSTVIEPTLELQVEHGNPSGQHSGIYGIIVESGHHHEEEAAKWKFRDFLFVTSTRNRSSDDDTGVEERAA